MTERYDEKPPEGLFEDINDVTNLSEITKLALYYSFQINCMADDENGTVAPSEAELHGHIASCVNTLDYLANRANLYGSAVEITGTAMHPSPSLDDNVADTIQSYGSFTGTYYGFAARAVKDDLTGMERWELGHIIEITQLQSNSFLRCRTDIFRAFMAVDDVELAETPQERMQRELGELVTTLDRNDENLNDLESVLFANTDSIDINQLGTIFDTWDKDAMSPQLLDKYLTYLNLQTQLLEQPVTVVASHFYDPQEKHIVLNSANNDISGVSRGFCIDSSLRQPFGQLCIAMSIADDEKIILIPATAVETYLFEEAN